MTITKTERKIQANLDKIYRETHLCKFFSKFGVEIETSWNFLDMALVSTRTDGEEFTVEQKSWLSGFSDGYAAAMTDVAGATGKMVNTEATE